MLCDPLCAAVSRLMKVTEVTNWSTIVDPHVLLDQGESGGADSPSSARLKFHKMHLEDDNYFILACKLRMRKIMCVEFSEFILLDLFYAQIL